MSSKKKRSNNSADPTDDLAVDVPVEQLHYEDPYEDEFDEEIVWDEADALDEDEPGAPVDDAEADALADAEAAELLADGAPASGASASATSAAAAAETPRVWLRRKHGLAADEQLTYDASAYDMLHALRVDWPCLSVGVLRDMLGASRRRFPHTMYVAAGTQADRAENNKLVLLKLSALRKTKYDDADSDASRSDDDLAAPLDDADDADDDDVDGDADVTWKAIKHDGAVNRLRPMPQRNSVIATWSERGTVFVWDAQAHIAALDNAALRAPLAHAPLAALDDHTTEGFALDWSPTVQGRLLSGDCASSIRVWDPVSGGAGWSAGSVYSAHTDSVEDVQWSPVERDVFASASVDKTVKVWDARSPNNAALSINAHDTDVNVIDWNSRVSYLIVSGADDGSFRIWDLRALDRPAAHFRWHNEPISSVEWSPTEDSVLAVACSEQVTIWDLSLERDAEAQAAVAAGTDTANDKPVLPSNLDEVDEDVPPQLLFVHQGQQDVKEVHFHPQIPGALVSTAYDNISVWKPCNVG